MAYSQKTWVDRVAESPNRRTITIESQTSTTIIGTVQRTEGEISKEGDAFNAENMNDLEERIAAGLDEKLDGQKLETDLDVILSKTAADGSAPDCYAIKLLYDELKKSVADGKKLIADAISAQGITTATSSMTFTELAAAIKTTGNTRYSNGYNTGYTKGKEDGTAAGTTSGYNTGYAAGKADGITYADGRTNTSSANYKAGYNAGVTAADARVNTASANYKGGYSAGQSNVTVSCSISGRTATARTSTGKTATANVALGTDNGSLGFTLTPSGNNTATKAMAAGYYYAGTVTAAGGTAYEAGKKGATASLAPDKQKASKTSDDGASRVSADFAAYPSAKLANGVLTLTLAGYASADMAYKNDHDLSTTATYAQTSWTVNVS